MKKTRRIGIVPVIGKGMVILIAVFVLVCCQSKTMPDALIGTWVTEDGRYSGCALEIGTVTLVFRGTMSGADVCPIKRLALKKDGTQLVATIRFTNQEDLASTATLIWSPERGGTLWFKNQPNIVWKRSSGNEGVSPVPAAVPATGG